MTHRGCIWHYFATDIMRLVSVMAKVVEVLAFPMLSTSVAVMRTMVMTLDLHLFDGTEFYTNASKI